MSFLARFAHNWLIFVGILLTTLLLIFVRFSGAQPHLDHNVRLGFKGGCLKAGRYDALHAFAKEVKADVYFGINALIGRQMPNCSDPLTGKPYACWALAEAHNKSAPPPACCTEWSGDWSPTQAAALFRYTASTQAIRLRVLTKLEFRV